jgi:6-phosphogluconate dehydrogenase
MKKLSDVGIVGLGVMGHNLARNFVSRGNKVVGHDLSAEAGQRLVQSAGNDMAAFVADAADFVARLERPRRILLMVNAGAPVDAVLDSLAPLLDEDDIVVDGGNSLYADTDRRNERAAAESWRFVGMGVSGGADGALRGPSMMPGGDIEAWKRLQPVLESIAAVSASGPWVTYCGTGSAGHYVKMVHNGIEYGDMQLIAETVTLLRRGLGLEPTAVADVFDQWNDGELDSFLVEISADIMRTEDPQIPGGLLVDAILDEAGQKGTGRWTDIAATEMGVAIPTIGAAVDARVMSADRALREQAQAVFGRPDGVLEGITVDDLRDALYAAKIASYTQGFAMLGQASAERGYGTDLSEIARIWTAGCIIRARFLDRVRQAFQAAEDVPLLALSDEFSADLASRVPAWRKVVASAVGTGIAIPGLAASLQWFDSLSTARGSANLIQAQRDYFGSHTYRRREDPSTPVHTDWASAARLAQGRD